MPVPDDVQEFLRDRVDTFEQLESLLLLWKQRTQKWTVEHIAERTTMRENAVATAVDELRVAGLVEDYSEEGATYVRIVTEASLGMILDRLQRAYDEEKLEVMKLMSKYAMERLRAAAVRTFADAFLVGRKKDG